MDAKVLDSPQMTAIGAYDILVSNTMVPLKESFTGFRSALCLGTRHDFHMLFKTLLPVIYNYGILATSILCILLRYMLHRYCALCTYSISSGPWNCRSVKYCPLHSGPQNFWSHRILSENDHVYVCLIGVFFNYRLPAPYVTYAVLFVLIVMAGHIFEFQCRIGHTSISFWIQYLKYWVV